MRLMLNIKRQTYVYDLDLHPMSSCQLFGFSPTNLKVIRLGISIFIFHFLGSSTKGVNLALLMKVIELVIIMLEVVQPRIVQPSEVTLKRGEVFGLRKA